MNDKNGNMFSSFVGGVVLGAVMGVLFAPEKGTVVREKISNKIKQGMNEVEKKKGELQSKVMEFKDKLENKTNEVKSEGKKKMRELREGIETNI